jgi:hypothetical protein
MEGCCQADIPIRKRYTARRNTARPVHGLRDENVTSRVPRAFCYSHKAGTRLGPHYKRALYRAYAAFSICVAFAQAHTLSSTPTRTRARSTMLNPRRIMLVGAVATLFGLAALVNAVPPAPNVVMGAPPGAL